MLEELLSAWYPHVKIHTDFLELTKPLPWCNLESILCYRDDNRLISVVIDKDADLCLLPKNPCKLMNSTSKFIRRKRKQLLKKRHSVTTEKQE
jgi:hypothetical protein